MTDIHVSPGVGGATAALPSAAERPTGAVRPATNFQALLEQLQQLARNPQTTPAVTSADDLGAAMHAAEQSFTTAMDLRQQLEEAFRRHMS
ncbi:MAG: hypothetical protein JNK15_12275 [Planctomycetes bacterium]|nr:hypothetical protein [Planctomycetota bacterium]